MFQRTRSIWRTLLSEQASPQSGAVATAEDDRRQWIRLPSDLETTFKVAGAPDNSRQSVYVRNISMGGINLLAACAFEPGALLTVALPGPAKEAHCDVLVCVVHCDEVDPGQWALGCTFSRELSEGDLQSLGAEVEREDQPDQREWKRFPCNITATIQLVSQDNPTPQPASVLNISPTGVGLLVTSVIENGSLLSVELRNGAGTVTRTMLACVVHVNCRSENEWALGCNFIRSLSEQDLQALL